MLIKEEGAGNNPAANTYADVESLRTYARLRGIDLLAKSDQECEVLLIRAMDFIESKRDKFKGYKTKAAQPLQWPRSDVWDVDPPKALYENDIIPRELEYGQLALAIEAIDHDLLENRLPTDKGAVVRTKVEGAIEIEYANSGTVQSVSAFAKADALLAPLYKKNGLFLVRS